MLVEDDEDDYLLTRHALAEIESPGFELDWASTFDDGLAAIRRHEHDVALVDNRLGVHTGLELLQQTIAEGCKTPIIMLTGTAILDTDLAAMAAGAADFLEKDLLSARLLERSIRYAIERRQAAEALARERALLRTLIDALPDYIFVKDTEGRFILSNTAHAEAVRAPDADALAGKTAFDFFPPDLAAQFDADDRAIMQSGNPLINQERQTVDAAGSRIWVATTKVPLRDAQGNVAGLVGISRDISERKQTEAALRQSEARLRTVITSAPIILFILNRDGVYTLSEGKGLGTAGLKPGQRVGQSLYDVYADRPDVIQNFHRALAGEALTYEMDNGEGRTYEIRLVPLPDPGGDVEAVIGVVTDITERKQAEGQRIHLEIERTKVEVFKRFIGDVSHDLRTPLSVMATSLYLLRKLADSDRQLHYIERLEEQISHMQKIVEDMFTLSRLEMAESEFQLRPGNLNSLVQMVCEQKQPLAERKNHQLSLRLADGLSQVALDQQEFSVALGHLLTNALNYTPDGGQIAVTTYLDHGQAVFEVRDNGIGISAEDLPHIFERFYRADKARTISTGGSGLGLTITRRIVEVHGGQIEAESTPGAGSVFRVRLPVAGQVGASAP